MSFSIIDDNHGAVLGSSKKARSARTLLVTVIDLMALIKASVANIAQPGVAATAVGKDTARVRPELLAYFVD
ncbi:hypothetical protein [Cupriavidus consociatus]|uniref:hypothetical protein n=1 Tax=Cupriavidus consociatus TaxID=2821357 RepID=UPI001AE4B79C|nr:MULTISPECIES: hypothetical protein [unclassified Cupriavidus]MBP0625246.1 hypothetical protein [Cupriavidus sp. LEh25]MDK2661981.1 hypothetical protein [Cupriavidus sp. LEh21]